MPVKISGLPAHVLLIHAVVVLLPLAAIMVVASAVWPAARRKLGFLSPATALVALVLVPITTHAGEWLEARLPRSASIEKHAHLGDMLLPWAIGLFVVSAAVWGLGRRYDTSWRAAPSADPEQDDAASGAPVGGASDGGSTATLVRPATTARRTLPVWVSIVVAVVAIAVATGTMVQLYRIGDSGAHAVWGGVADLPARSGS